MTNKLNIEKEREAFELWAAPKMRLDRYEHCDDYSSEDAYAAWGAWMERAEQSCNAGRWSVIRHQAQRIAELESKQEWVSVRKFEENPVYGWCWIVHKGSVVESYFRERGYFAFSRCSPNCYMTECISAVMPWRKPQPPEQK